MCALTDVAHAAMLDKQINFEGDANLVRLVTTGGDIEKSLSGVHACEMNLHGTRARCTVCGVRARDACMHMISACT